MSKHVLCPPLQQLKNEHISLKADMDRFYDLAEEIEFETGPSVLHLFSKLLEQVKAFTKALAIHSNREENALFPMISRHLEDGDNTIKVMEYEHEKAEQHLNDFLTEAEQAGATIDEITAQSITVSAVQAYATLTQHFAKEENNLFPLAETILSPEEKNELERLLLI